MPKATLLVIHGPDQGTRYEIKKEIITIGRGAGNKIRLLDTEVSRRHAQLEYRDGRFQLNDLKSSNGSYLNGNKVESKTLTNGDRIQFGQSVLLFGQNKSFADSQEIANKIEIVHPDASDESSMIKPGSSDASPSVIEKSLHDSNSLTKDHETLTNLQVLYRIIEEAVTPSLSPEQLLSRILKLTIEVVGADRGCVLVLDEESGTLNPQVYLHSKEFEHSSRMPVSRTIVDYVVKECRGVRTSDAQRDQRFEEGMSIVQAGICEAMCVPMQGRYELLGVIYVDTTTPHQKYLENSAGWSEFNEEKLRLLSSIGRQSAIALENNRYQESLVKAERMAAMGQTIAMLSHHIKNILQGVRGGSYLIDMGLNNHDEDVVRKGWGIVDKNQNKIYNLVMDMLTFSKERDPAFEITSLNETVQDVCELMQSRAEEKNVKLETNFDTDIGEASFDPEGINRAVMNVVTNAIDAAEGKENGAVRVETGYEKSTDVVFVAVTDNGSGIPEKQLAKIYQIFESTKGAKGTGLGLAVSRKIIREHGGDITVESKEGKGSRFVLSWPRMDEDHRSIESSTGVDNLE